VANEPNRREGQRTKLSAAGVIFIDENGEGRDVRLRMVRTTILLAHPMKG
jgi:hypothetical protein